MPSSTGSVSPESMLGGIGKSNRVDCGSTATEGLDGTLEPIAFVDRTRNV